ncbi:lactonase family protein [Paraburkholderia hayleyella]|uniref:lactonase family protein n=1 Tax=Paraburkholderia hayleyella TaxID=2152889 RepID=UPI00129092B2|nr:beta-propeller fold lactonase family protein [Paraburkholderia hayleyella]
MTPHTCHKRRTVLQWIGGGITAGALTAWLPANAQTAARTSPDAAGRALPVASPRFAYVGTYTNNVPGSITSQGIYVFALKNDTWTQVQAVASENPSFLALHPSQRFLYAINEIDRYEGLPTGSAEAYAIDPNDGHLTLLNRQPLSLSGTGPAHLAVSPDGRYLVVALYGGGAYNVLPVDVDGTLGKVSGIRKEISCAPDKAQQELPHPHMVLFDPTGTRVLAADLGSNRLTVFELADGKLEVQARIATPPGSGPRHLVLHPSGHLLYVVNELGASVACYGYDAIGGRILEQRYRVSTVPKEFTGQKNAAALVIHPSGRYLYASNRKLESEHPLADSVVVYLTHATSGALAPLQYWNEGLSFPRALTMAPDGGHLYALSQKGDNILRLRIDPVSGLLDQPTQVAQVPKPVCLVFA